jgi:peptide deformylase
LAIYKILYLPDERLRKIAKPVEHFDDSLQTLIDDMFATMYNAKGVGLAAPQIGIDLCLSVIDVVGDKQQQLVLANPEIIAQEGEAVFEEGCLSIPKVYDTVKRAHTVTVRAQDRFGNFFSMTSAGLLGECFQHEIDHLNGKLFIDLLSPIRRAMARKKLDKFKRETLRRG